MLRRDFLTSMSIFACGAPTMSYFTGWAGEVKMGGVKKMPWHADIIQVGTVPDDERFMPYGWSFCGKNVTCNPPEKHDFTMAGYTIDELRKISKANGWRP